MISVVIPLYNKELTIEKSLKTVLSQDYDDFEVVVVNDGSTDRSAEIVKGIYDSRICLIEQENGGPSKARNTGVKNAKGEWVVFLDADDELTECALKKMMLEVRKYPDADIVDFNGYIRSRERMSLRYHPLVGKVSNPLCAFYYRKITPGCGHSIFRASFAKQYPYDERLRRFEDCDILLRMLPKAKVYSSQYITEIHDMNYAEASNARKDIKEDFTGYLDMSKGGFWYKMCVFRTFLEEREHYAEECHRLYPSWYKRYDLIVIMKMLALFGHH
jgi:glycosyltransferase involved in cell wall biosynthesis